MPAHGHTFRPVHHDRRGPPAAIRCIVCGRTLAFTETDA